MTDQEPMRGRPRAADPAAVSASGLAILNRQGWEKTSMAQIARECELSTATLFRYFPSKAELFWFGMERNEQIFVDELEGWQGHPGLIEGMLRAYRNMLERSGQLPAVKARMALVARDDDAARAAAAVYNRWRNIAIDHVARNSDDTSALRARVVGSAWWAAVWAAMTTWALDTEVSPATYLDEAIVHLCSISLRPDPSEAAKSLGWPNA